MNSETACANAPDNEVNPSTVVQKLSPPVDVTPQMFGDFRSLFPIPINLEPFTITDTQKPGNRIFAFILIVLYAHLLLLPTLNFSSIIVSLGALML